ncbi:DUF4838 domain-containing protein [Pedobacter aquatilis]|uniref:DUF4838 domain-containing protein n=1 Tax=Pedobacter aquatilis TaxID=351343 RepID=UPI00292E1FF6|nr:DUF4838 domain-containing protein [Pedobacter aquatilis]
MLKNAHAQLNLVQDSKSAYKIVVPSAASAVENRAASVLKQYISEISNATVEIITDRTPEQPLEICIGKTNRTNSTEKLVNDDFIIKTADKKLLIWGENGKSTLYGVYHFLDEYLGCRKFSAKVNFIPKSSNIKINNINDVQHAKLAFRQVYYPDQYDEEYRDWHKLQLLEDEWGLWGHTFDKLVPAKTYFDEHPEYFALVNGERKATQLCLSNPDVYRILVKNLKELIAAHPEKKYWSVSQNDGFGFCTCDKCSATDLKFGGPQGSLISFVNKVAANFPDKTISTLAYLYTKHPPKGIKPADNVSIMLSTIDVDRAKPIASNPAANGFRNDLQGWAKLTGQLMIWDYVVQFTNYLSPFPNLNTLAANMNYFDQYKVSGIFIQGTENNLGEFSSLKSYLLVKASWNPAANLSKERDEFMQAYYGKATPLLKKYNGDMEASLAKSNRVLDIYGDPVNEWNSWLSPENIDQYSSTLDAAELAVSNVHPQHEYVVAERLALEYAVLQQARFYGLERHGIFSTDGKNWRINPGIERKINRFIEMANANGVKQLSEDGLSLETYASEWKKTFMEGPALHLAVGKTVKTISAFNNDYPAKGSRTLTDGSRGYNNFQYNYLGWLGNDMEVVIDLGKEQAIKKITAGFLEDQRHWAFLPVKISVSFSKDNIAFGNLNESVQSLPEENYEKETHRISIDIKGIATARFIKIKAENLKKLPEWRDYPNRKPWLFCDELEVY